MEEGLFCSPKMREREGTSLYSILLGDYRLDMIQEISDIASKSCPILSPRTDFDCRFLSKREKTCCSDLEMKMKSA